MPLKRTSTQLENMASDLLTTAHSLLTSPTHTRQLTLLLLPLEALLCALIIAFIPFTEIDFQTYLIQASHFISGERSYSKLVGPSGPCVYPALHVYIYSAFYYITNKGNNVVLAQILFAGLYLATLALVFACYRRVGAPPYLFVLLVLSKRMHSIFLLRLFNDCFASFLLWASIYLFLRRKFEVGVLVWGFALAVKMTALVAVPGLLFVVLQGAGAADALFGVVATFMAQCAMAFPFLNDEVGFEYLWRAFDLGRVFLYKWTVNWRFVGEDVFSSTAFAISLLVIHVSLLAVFIQTKWIQPSGFASIGQFVKKYTWSMTGQEEMAVEKKVTPTYIMDTMLSSIVIGLLCARSLHYQFYAYLGWASPYLLWRAGGGWTWVLINWAVQEYCWLVFPSTDVSSMVVVFELAIQLVSILIAPTIDSNSPAQNEAVEQKPALTKGTAS